MSMIVGWRAAHPDADVPEWFDQFADESSRDEACPKFRIGEYIVWVDYADPQRSELVATAEGYSRFVVQRVQADDPAETDENDLFRTNALAEFQAWLAEQDIVG